MTGLVRRLISSLSTWLLNPRIEVVVTTSDEVLALRSEVDTLHSQIDDLQMEVHRAQQLYGQECVINLRLQDQLRSLR